MAIKLYSWPRSSGTRIAWALEELGLSYEYVELDAKKREHQEANFLAINPYGKIPALVDDDKKLFESGAILLYLGDKYGAAKQLWPSIDDRERADALSWTVWSVVELGPHVLQYLYHGLDSPVSYQRAHGSKAAAEYSLSQLNRCLATIDARLANREHLLGNFSLVDIAASSWLMFGTTFGVKLDAHPRAAAWFKRCTSRPALKRAR